MICIAVNWLTQFSRQFAKFGHEVFTAAEFAAGFGLWNQPLNCSDTSDLRPMPDVLRVALPVPIPELFDYLPPADAIAQQIAVGARLRVPFGRREAIGVVVEHGHSQADNLRAAIVVIDAKPSFPESLWQTLCWAARYFACPLGEVLATALPAPVRQGREARIMVHEQVLRLRPSTALRDSLKRGSAAEVLYDALIDGPCTWAELRQRIPRAASARRRLLELGLIELLALDDAPRRVRTLPPALSEEQQAAVAAIAETLGSFQTTLLDGVTGSGKTEVYLALIEQVLQRGEQALVLVPEIGLTPQTLARFRERLSAPVVVWHSGVGDAARARAFERARAEEPLVVLGTRSAIFAPLPKLGLIILDEEHDASFKQQDGFRYHARSLALMRAKQAQLPVLLGSATPALETLANVARGRHRLVRLTRRVGPARPPQIELIDVRRERLRDGLGAKALAALSGTLARGEQALVFRNRRGFATALHCGDCGWHGECAACARPFTVHRRRGRLICHHCHREQPLPKHCPQCGSPGVTPVGVGTERLESGLGERFPGVPVLRIDRDATRSAAQFEHALATAQGGQACILVGTQMLAKGHDLHGVTLAVIADADGGLFSTDPRAAERLAQLIVQVAGRTGRGARRGQVLIQTHHPEHPLFRTLLAGGYRAFADQELQLRQTLGFPPFSSQALLRAEARDRAPVDNFLAAMAAAIRSAGIHVAGPLPAPHARRAGFERAQLLLESAQRSTLHAAIVSLLPTLYRHPLARKLRWSIDVDPIALD